jgi:hypothetical protein
MATPLKFTEPLAVPSGPRILHAGTIRYGGGESPVTLPVPCAGEYVVLLTPGDSNTGAIARSSDTFSVSKKTSTGFSIFSDNSRSKASVDFLVIGL